MRKGLLLVSLTMVFAAVCCFGMARPADSEEVVLNLKRPVVEYKDVGFTFNNDNLCSPLEMRGGPQGTIYFETADRKRVYIKGDPLEKTRIDGKFTGKWQAGDRVVEIIIEYLAPKYYITFKATPDEDIYRWGFSLRAEPDEYFTGLFERTVDGDQKKSWEKGVTEAMNLRGQSVDMIIKPTLGLYSPFYISSRGYSLFVEGTWPGYYDFCNSNEELVQIWFDGHRLDMLLNTAKEPAKLVKDHSLYVGPTIVPPKWAFRHWRWRDDHTNRETYYDGSKVNAPYNSEVVEDVLMMEAMDIPCGVYWVDRPWAVGDYGYDDFEWDRQRLPRPKEMIEWLDNKGMKFVLWIAPWVNGDMAKEAYSKGYNIRGQRVHRKDRPLIDFTNPEAKKWWQYEGVKKVLDDGVAGFKLDRSEETMPDGRDRHVKDGRTNREARNAYPVEYVKATWEIAREVRGDDFVLLPRAGYTHSSRFGVFWGGDIATPQEGLRCAIIAQMRCAVIGYPIWGSDTGGYWQGPMDREVLARWMGFSCFSPIMEVGPTENLGLWNLKTDPSYDAQNIAIWRLYAKIHDKLLDYTYKYALEARRTGMPVARPLFLHWPEQKQAWQDWQTFMYGQDILVSAIWQKGKNEHSLYLPGGVNWVDAWDTSKVYTGGETVKVSTPIYKIPIFIRQGSEVDLGNLKSLYRDSLELAKSKPSMAELEKKEFGN